MFNCLLERANSFLNRFRWRILGLRYKLNPMGGAGTRRFAFIFAIPPSTKLLIGLCTFFFLIQQTAEHIALGRTWSFATAMGAQFGIIPDLLCNGFWWQPLTYAFLHVAWWHLLLNMLGVLFMGSYLERTLGSRPFWRIFLLGAIVGGLSWFGVDVYKHSWSSTQLCIGASGGVMALLGAMLALQPPRDKITLLLFFIVPIRIQCRFVPYLILVATVAEALFLSEFVAWAAHLGGFLTGTMLGRLYRRKIRWSVS